MRGKTAKLATIAKKTAIVIHYSYTDVFPRSTKTFKPSLKKTGHKVGGNLKLFLLPSCRRDYILSSSSTSDPKTQP